MDQKIMGDKREYLSALEVERKKIELFSKELPLSLQIVNETIETLRKQMENQQLAVVEEIIPINLNISYSENDEIEHDKSDKNEKVEDWSCSLRLWNRESEKDSSTTDKRPNEASIVDINRCISEEQFSNGQEDGQDKIERKEKDKEKEKEEQKDEAQKKTRRSWSQELHRRFVNALEQLGGADVATPKHIRELMKVDGLTNDEVKSHLQKYRLHTKKPSSRVRNITNDYASQAPQFVLVGAWVSPADCSGSEDSIGAANIIHPSLVSLPSHLILPHENKKSNLHGSPTGPLQKYPTRDRTAKSASSQTTNGSF